MRTLHVDTGKEMGGGQWQALYLVERLDEAALLAPEGSPLLAEARKRDLDAAEFSLPAYWKRSRRVDLIHVHDARAHMFAASAGGRTPLIVSRRVGFPVKDSMASRWKYAHAARYIAVSKFVASRLRDAGIEEAKIRVVYDGVPIPGPSSHEPGRVVALESKSVALDGISVKLTTNLWDDLSTASVFVYVSELEGLGSGALAAMAAGVPVVASGAGGLAEAVEDGWTGIMVAPSEIAGAVRRLLDDPAKAAEMGRRARERATERFSVDTMVEGTVRVYEEVLA